MPRTTSESVRSLGKSRRRVWFISDVSLREVQELLTPESDAVVALGYQVVHWARERGIEVYLPPDLLEFAQLSALRSSAELAVESLVSLIDLAQKRYRIGRLDLELVRVDTENLKFWSYEAVQVALVARALEDNGIAWNFPPSPTGWDPKLHTNPDFSSLTAIYLRTLIGSGHLAGPEAPLRLRSNQSAVGRRKPVPVKLRVRMVLGGLVRRTQKALSSREESRLDAVVVAYDSDLSRKREQFADLLDAGLRVIFVPYSSRRAGNPRRTRRMGEHIGLPVAMAPTGSCLSARIRALRFRRFMRSGVIDERSMHEPFSPTRSLESVAKHIGARWGVLGAERAAWRRYWRQVHPHCVVVVRSIDTWSIPAFAAADKRIAVCSVPHGVAESRSGAFLAPTPEFRRIIHLTPFVVSTQERERGYVSSSSEMTLHEYPRTQGDKGSLTRRAGKHIVLILVDHNNVMMNGLTDAREQARFVCDIARSLPTVTFAVKDHPSGPVFHHAFPENFPQNVVIADPAEDLHVAIARSSAIILLNYWGSAAVHSFASIKPLARVRLGRAFSGICPPVQPIAMQVIAEDILVLSTLSETMTFIDEIVHKNFSSELCERNRSKIATIGPSLQKVVEAAALEGGWERLLDAMWMPTSEEAL